MLDLSEYIRPELLSLIPALYLLGTGLKKAAFIRDGYIPLLLGAAGVAGAALWVFAASDISGYRDALMAVFVALTQGILCAGASVYVNQVGKQVKKQREEREVEHYKD